MVACARSLMERTEASDAFDAGSIPVERMQPGSTIVIMKDAVVAAVFTFWIE